MGFLAVIAAAAVAWIWGAIWYGIIGKPWMAAAGLSEETINRKDPLPYIGSFVCAVVVAGMLRHVLATAEVQGIGGGLINGFGLGLFVAVPWMATNVLFQQRDKRLIWMDGAYPTVGMALMGAVLMLF